MAICPYWGDRVKLVLGGQYPPSPVKVENRDQRKTVKAPICRSNFEALAMIRQNQDECQPMS